MCSFFKAFFRCNSIIGPKNAVPIPAKTPIGIKLKIFPSKNPDVKTHPKIIRIIEIIFIFVISSLNAMYANIITKKGPKLKSIEARDNGITVTEKLLHKLSAIIFTAAIIMIFNSFMFTLSIFLSVARIIASIIMIEIENKENKCVIEFIPFSVKILTKTPLDPNSIPEIIGKIK